MACVGVGASTGSTTASFLWESNQSVTKELQLHQVEGRGLAVLEHTSEEGRVHILRDVERLRESWTALHDLSLNLYSREEGSDEDAPRQSHSPWASQIQTDLKWGDEVDVGLRVDTEVDDAEGELESYRQSTPVFGTEDVGHSLGSRRSLNWTEDRVKGGSRDGSNGSPGKALVTGTSVLSGTVGSSSATGDWISDDRSPYGRGQGSGAASLHGVDGSVALESNARMRSGGGPAAEGLGQGGGAFTLFQRGATTPQSSSPLQSNSSGPRSMACVGVGASTGSTTASFLWESNQSVTGSGRQAVSPAEYESRRREFEAWLGGQNELLSGILSTKGATLGPKELKIRTGKLQALRADVGWGQELFQLLIHNSQAAGAGAGSGCLDGPELMEDTGLEELRYRWMLYKSKLKEVGDLRARLGVKTNLNNAEASILLTERLHWDTVHGAGASCSLANNFARSFNLMLRYDGPPP
ncbi:hypothetical protein CRUP_013206, partial [Coryphaenoides rupestris]